MYPGANAEETVSVLGTPAFMDFVESIKQEGVDFKYRPMGQGTHRHESLVVEVDTENKEKDLDKLDIALPRLTRRFSRDFKNLDALEPARFGNQLLPLKPFTPEETREIVFKTMLDAEIHHTIMLDGSGPADYRSVVAFFARQLLKDLRLVGGYDVLYGRVKTFMRDFLFTPSPVNLEDPVVLRNLSEPDAGKILYDSFKSAINALTIQESGTTCIEDRIRLREMRPFRTDYRANLPASKSIFNKIVGEPNSGGFELSFAVFLEAAPDVEAFAKNYFAVGFKLDYVRANGDLSNYTPDFIVRTNVTPSPAGGGRGEGSRGTIWLVETKGRAELDLPQKMARLKQWCADATAAEAAEGGSPGRRYDFVFVDQTGFEKHAPKNFAALATSFTEYK
jgi:type III restriction enzyme